MIRKSQQDQKRFYCVKNKTGGFTLIELLVVIAILGVLTTIGLANFRSSQIRSRDSKRKSDLGQIQRAVEMYFNDYNTYPIASGGLISLGLTDVLDWGQEFIDSNGTVYIKELPSDPTGNPPYCYASAGTSYQIYARLENSQDPKIAPGGYTCNGNPGYNYGVASPNSEP